jgi:putative copper resistance protein D
LNPLSISVTTGARFALLTLAVGLFGDACFQLYAPWARQRRGPAWPRTAAALAAALAGLAWIAALARDATGVTGLPDPATVARLATLTGFGRALGVAVILALALAVLSARRRGSPRTMALLSGALLACLAFVGHAAAAAGVSGAVRIAVMALHLLLAGLWLGGLLPLALALRAPDANPERLLRTFGRTAVGAVAALAATGMIDAAAILSLARGPPGAAYLATFGVKLALAAALLALAGVNRWALTPLAARSPAGAVRALAWSLGLEQVLALALLAVVARLAQLDPGM